jgi:hypothetical protein
MSMAGNWLPAGRFLAARIQAAARGGDWRGDWIEADIINALARGELTARGRKLAFDRLHPHQIDPTALALIPGSERKPKHLPVAVIPTKFWSDTIQMSGAQWPDVSRTHWPEAVFSCGDDQWQSVEILEPKARRAGGRPAVYDWAAIEAEMMRLLEIEGGLSGDFKMADLERAAGQWAEDNFGQQPAVSNVRKHANAAVQRFNDGKTVI